MFVVFFVFMFNNFIVSILKFNVINILIISLSPRHIDYSAYVLIRPWFNDIFTFPV